jgi:hypothetical protein
LGHGPNIRLRPCSRLRGMTEGVLRRSPGQAPWTFCTSYCSSAR